MVHGSWSFEMVDGPWSIAVRNGGGVVISREVYTKYIKYGMYFLPGLPVRV
jgi:hypothetical protein